MSSPVSESSEPYLRHPLGLPPGSVRSVLALMIAGLFWLLIAMPEGHEVAVPPFLYFLLALILLFFGAHGHTIGRHLGDGRSPLGLPHGSVRALIVIGTAAVLGWLYYSKPEQFVERLTPDQNRLGEWPMLVLASVGAFTVGYLVRLGPWRNTPGFQDCLASLSLVAMLGLVAETIIVVFIKPNSLQGLDLKGWEAILTAVVAFYFGARS
jgi:hypothetical protein